MTKTKTAPDRWMPRLESVKRIEDIAAWESARLFTDSYVLFAVMKGTGRLSMEREEYDLEPNQLYLCAPKRVYQITEIFKGQLRLYVLNFQIYEYGLSGRETLQLLSEADPLFVQQPLTLNRTDPAYAWIADISDKAESVQPLERYEAQILFQRLLLHLLAHQNTARNPGSALNETKAYIDLHYRSSLNIERLAQIANLSPNYFVEQFKKTFGLSAIEYLTSVRMKEARQLLARSAVRPRKLREIAAAVGYQDEFYFSRKFKMLTGVSPSQYVKSRRRKIACCDAASAGYLLALQLIPYAAPLHPKWTAHYYDSIREDVAVHLSAYRNNQHWASNLGLLAQAEPELILYKAGISPAERERLEQLAPAYGISPYSIGWREQLLQLGEMLDERPEAEHWLGSYERKARTAKSLLKHTLKEERMLVLRIFGREIHVYSNRSVAEVLYGDLNVQPAYQRPEPLFDEKVSLSKLQAINASRLLVLIRQETETLKYWSELQHSADWQALEAVRQKRVHLLSSDLWFEYSPAAHERIVDRITGMLTEDSPD
ncbi:helix-turn-helix domain-containing protein [Paenibacillus pinistramenti]|uniref:helix-turn-helix domain-containing protein n=1 Tax=Paenibacillus pinistramenti TaxID=1768003 RepID=UPI001108BF58|nr:AraC family transcriptional regulator [Paenibacillus pinistramenti]